MYRTLIRKSYSNIKHKSNVLTWQQFNGIQSSPTIVSQAGFGKYLVILAPFITVGGVAAYAKHDDDFRKLIIKNVPLAEKPLKVILGEENPLASVTDTFDDLSKSVTGLFGGDGPKPDDVKIQPKKVEKSTPPITSSPSMKSQPVKPSETLISTPPPPQIDIPQPTKPASPSSVQPPKPEPKSTISAAAVAALLPSDLEKSIENTAAIAIDEYRKAINVLRAYNDEVKRIVEQSIEKHDKTLWANLENKAVSRDAFIKMAEATANDARLKIKQIENSLSKNNNLDVEAVNNLKTTIRNVSDNLDLAKLEFSKLKDNVAEYGDKFWRRVEQARSYFDRELQSLFPNLNLAEKRLNLSKTELDLYLLHAYSYVLAYQKDLQKLELHEESKTRKEIEKELEIHMKRQTAAHLEHLKEVIELKENEMKRKFTRELDEKVSNEQNAYKLQLASMLGKLKGMNDALKEIDKDIKERAGAEKSAQQAQALWSACISLWNSVKHGDPTVSWDKRIRPLANEIKAINDSAVEGDRLVVTVLKTIPEEVQKRGVYPEDALRERFFKVSKLARRLALVPEDGARLPVYILSYLQSIFVLNQNDQISKEEINDEKIDFNKLDTYDILNRAKYWLDHGNIAQSLKYMNLLNGASRKVAKDWINEARIYLETQQAVNTLLAYAESSGR
jgi:mitofilin